MFDLAQSSKCLLCYKNAPLKNSHIIPKLVVKMTRDLICYTKHPHFMDEKGNPTQDLPKKHLLCEDCEQLLSNNGEGQAGKLLYRKLHSLPFDEIPSSPLEYKEWLLKFGTSLCWRVLNNSWIYEDWSNKKHSLRAVSNLHSRWRKYLIGKLSFCDSNAISLQVIRPVPDLPAQYKPAIKDLHTYMLSATSWKILNIRSEPVVYIKTGRLLWLGGSRRSIEYITNAGLIQRNGTFHWPTIDPKSQTFSLLHQDATKNAPAFSKPFNEKRLNKVAETVTPEELLESDAYKCMVLDRSLQNEDLGS